MDQTPSLPANAAEPMASTAPPAPAEPVRHTVLLVDDEMGILRALKRVLRRDGHEVVLANGGREGIEVLESREVHLIICDQRMPEVAGPEVLARAFELQPNAFRITLTGQTDLKAAQQSINEGHVNQFLMKPWDDDQIRKSVTDGLRSYQLVVENRRLQELTRSQNAELEAWNQTLEAKVTQRTEELTSRNAQINQTHKAVERMLHDYVEMTASLMEVMSPSLGLHSKRVAQLSKRVGTWMKVSPMVLRDLELTGYLHDLGKVASLTDDSADAAGSSAEVGFQMLGRVAGFHRIALAVRHQADRFDGEGNVSGLVGEKIPIISRVLAVVEAYDAAVFVNPEDPTQIDPAAGRRVLQEQAGKTLDPKVAHELLQRLKPVAAAAAAVSKAAAPEPQQAQAQSQAQADVEAPAYELVDVPAKHVREKMIIDQDLVNNAGVLMVKGGTMLTQAMVERIRKMAHVELLLKTLAIRVLPPEPETKTQAAA